ncbi:MAG: SRPBCC family protein [Panacibacter sp.]
MNILIIVVIVIALPFIIALFSKKEYAVEREIIISKPKQQVFNYIRFLKNQNNYSVWNMKDPNMKQEFKGTDGTVGFVSAWDSTDKNVGKGEQEIKKITEGESLELNLHFIKPFDGLANARMTTKAISENETKVTWGFDSKMKYPMNIMLLVMNMEKMLGKDLGTGLNNLKTVLEKE